jgi:hypothetical protein
MLVIFLYGKVFVKENVPIQVVSWSVKRNSIHRQRRAYLEIGWPAARCTGNPDFTSNPTLSRCLDVHLLRPLLSKPFRDVLWDQNERQSDAKRGKGAPAPPSQMSCGATPSSFATLPMTSFVTRDERTGADETEDREARDSRIAHSEALYGACSLRIHGPPTQRVSHQPNGRSANSCQAWIAVNRVLKTEDHGATSVRHTLTQELSRAVDCGTTGRSLYRAIKRHSATINCICGSVACRPFKFTLQFARTVQSTVH